MDHDTMQWIRWAPWVAFFKDILMLGLLFSMFWRLSKLKARVDAMGKHEETEGEGIESAPDTQGDNEPQDQEGRIPSACCRGSGREDSLGMDRQACRERIP